MRKKNKFREIINTFASKIIICGALSVLFFSCAQIGTPNGGIYDRIPPKAKSSKPPHNSTNFKEKSFEIVFDEYISTENTSEEMIISPPLKNKPVVKAHLKTLKVSWTDTLEENTTYIFDFGSSIIDYTEGNRLNNFVYSFSTGNVIDTLEYKGKVLEAYSLKPVAKKYVMLYKSEEKDIAKKEKPSYITRTDSNGNYHFQNIAKGTYQILALDDKNQNLIYDLSNEGIAFSKERVESTFFKLDTSSKTKVSKNNILYFFEPKDSLISLSSSKLLSNYRLRLIFSKSTTDSLDFVFEYPKFSWKEDKDLYVQCNITKDTIDIWSLKQSIDSVKMRIIDIGLKEEIELFNLRKIEDKIKDTFSLKTPASNQAFFEKCLIEMPFPIIDTSTLYKATRISNNDTFTIHLRPSSASPLYLEIEEKLPQNSKQTIIIPQGIIKNSLNQTNDSLSFSLQIDSESDYGNFFFNINDTLNENMSYILILEDSQGKALNKNFSNNNERITFSNLKEGSYKLRIILDMNKNKEWDYGDYSQSRLPEEILYFPKPINIRKNWDLEETWHN
ncbi:MAG: Ig-like domain-containing protein [Bacteroidales bacterium]